MIAKTRGGSVKAAASRSVLMALAPRWFLLRDVYRRPSLVLAQSRTTLSWLRGPMTRGDIKALGRQG